MISNYSSILALLFVGPFLPPDEVVTDTPPLVELLAARGEAEDEEEVVVDEVRGDEDEVPRGGGDEELTLTLDET
jgi:hypothetical protein